MSSFLQFHYKNFFMSVEVGGWVPAKYGNLTDNSEIIKIDSPDVYINVKKLPMLIPM